MRLCVLSISFFIDGHCQVVEFSSDISFRLFELEVKERVDSLDSVPPGNVQKDLLCFLEVALIEVELRAIVLKVRQNQASCHSKKRKKHDYNPVSSVVFKVEGTHEQKELINQPVASTNYVPVLKRHGFYQIRIALYNTDGFAETNDKDTAVQGVDIAEDEGQAA
jgi:hypothetical protein